MRPTVDTNGEVVRMPGVVSVPKLLDETQGKGLATGAAAETLTVA